MSTANIAEAGNGEPLALEDVPVLPMGGFQAAALEALGSGQRCAAFFADRRGDEARLTMVLADDRCASLQVLRCVVSGSSFPSMTPTCPQLHLFEREIAESAAIVPEGHPWLKPVRYPQQVQPAPGGEPTQAASVPGVADFYRVEGEEVHEVAVGPVHAGIIEPGHFRFQCHGETVFHLEIALGYQHRGIERALAGGPTRRTIYQMETVAGDTTIGHTTAYCNVIEALSGCRVPPRAHAIRAIALELERMANHVGDLGALAGDVGFLPTSSYCGRIRGDFLNMTALLCGSRFGRGLVRPGGVAFDIDTARAELLCERIEAAATDTRVAVELLWDTASVMARFEETGAVSLERCEQLGMVGPPARACGARRDVRQDFPTGIYRFNHIPVATWTGGDVFARAYVRWLEIQQSLKFLIDQLRGMPAGRVRAEVGPLAPRRIVTALVEGWRGEICHVTFTDDEGRFAGYKIVDPSFHNWTGLAMALRGQQISDFPLCNKSFNLSYCGYDL